MYENYENLVAILNLKKIKKKILMSKKLTCSQTMFSSGFYRIECRAHLTNLRTCSAWVIYYACVSFQPIEAWSYVVLIRQVICKHLNKCFKLSNTSRVQVSKNICDIVWWGGCFVLTKRTPRVKLVKKEQTNFIWKHQTCVIICHLY